jgi:hypothetical protein
MIWSMIWSMIQVMLESRDDQRLVENPLATLLVVAAE